MTEKADELVDSYLTRLNWALHDVPEARKREVVEEIRGHIAEARAELPSDGEAEIRNILERLGDPAEIAAEARGRFGVQVRTRGGEWREVTAIVLLLFGAFVAVLGWIVGVILLWLSDRWTVRDKLIGSLIVPFGLLPAFVLATTPVGDIHVEGSCSGQYDSTGALIEEVCTGGWTTGVIIEALVKALFFLYLLFGPLFTALYLALRLRKSAPERTAAVTT